MVKEVMAMELSRSPHRPLPLIDEVVSGGLPRQSACLRLSQ